MTVKAAQLDELIRSQKPSFLADYKKIVECPSVSAQPDHKKDMEEVAKIASEYLRAAGAEVKIWPTGGNPVVLGRFENKKGAPTVAVYNHLDVQPATKGKDGWTRDPFRFTEEGGRFYSRGTTDDKGPAMTAFWAAKMARELKLPINIEFIWELEEEIGSPHFEEFLKNAKKGIQADSVVVSDTQWLARGKPAIASGLRGLVACLVRLRTGKMDTHSGSTGGAARNPVTELCALIASCVDGPTGEIKIPGFNKTWKPLTRAEKAELVESGFSVKSFKAAHKLEKMRTEDAAEVLNRIWGSPTFEVHGIAGGYQDAGVKTIVPPFAEAKVSMRLVPGQDAAEIYELFEKHVKKIIPDCEVIREGYLEPYASPRDLPQFKSAEEAIEFGFGRRPVRTMEGGSIGAVVTMDKLLRVPIVMMGLSLPEDAYHGPDESFAWEQIEGGVKSFVKYFELLSTAKKA